MPRIYPPKHPLTRAIERLCNAVLARNPQLDPTANYRNYTNNRPAIHYPPDEPASLDDITRAREECGEPWPGQ